MRLLRLSGERGLVLPVTLGILAVLSISTVAVVDYATMNSKTSSRSGATQNAFALAEAGLNNALGVLLKPETNALDKYVYCPDANTLPTLPCWNTSTYEGGSVRWTGTLTVGTDTAYWTLTSSATAANPSGSKSLARTLTARVPVYPVESQPLTSPAWNYIYSRATGTGQAFNGCDMTLGNSVAVNSPLYVNGNLCMQNTATIIGGGLFVRGSLTMSQSANRVGSSGAPINDAHIAKGCKYLSQSSHTPCLGGAGGSPTFADNIWASTLDSNAGNIEPPSVSWNDWYLNASPGPYFSCNAPGAGDFSNPTFAFDPTVAAMSASDATKLTFKNNNAGLVNLTPATSYTCKTYSGELSWNATTRALKIKGTIYIDGSAKIDNGATNSYTGQGVIYLSGTMLVKNSKLCGKIDSSNTSNCTTSDWNPNTNLITFVAAGNGSTGPPDNQAGAGNSVSVVSSHVQGAIYGANIVEVATTSLVDGPLDGSTVVLGQTSNSAFPPFTIVPSGMPGNKTIFAVAGAPEMFSG